MLAAGRDVCHDIEYDYPDLITSEVTNPYVSAGETPLSVDEIRQLLKDYKLLTAPEETTSTRYWPGDKEEKN